MQNWYVTFDVGAESCYLLIKFRVSQFTVWNLSSTATRRWHCWCKQHKSCSFRTFLYCAYLHKFYDKSIIILLKNVLRNICREISEILLILLMVYTCNAKELEEVEMNVLCIFDQDHHWRMIAVDHNSKFKSFIW